MMTIVKDKEVAKELEKEINEAIESGYLETEYTSEKYGVITFYTGDGINIATLEVPAAKEQTVKLSGDWINPLQQRLAASEE